MNKLTPADGKLGILMPGLGAVGTTFIAGVEAIRLGISAPIGSYTQIGRIRLDGQDNFQQPLVKEFVPLASLDSLVFGCWDIFEDNAYEAAVKAGVLEQSLLDQVKKPLEAIKPMKAVFDNAYVRNLDGGNVKKGNTKFDLAQSLREDIRRFKSEHKCDRVVMVWCASTETYKTASDVHDTIEAFENGLKENAPEISPSQIYCYASIMEKTPFANGAPNLTVDIPALISLANDKGVAISGKDFKTGQTLLKTILAPGLRERLLGVKGWYSTNILGNRDGKVLDDPGSFKTKEVAKLSVLKDILDADAYPELYDDIYHKVTINYYPPRGDSKEGWDNIDIFGWLGYQMQIKINFLCRDSILAAPIVLDLALLIDLAQRAGLSGIQGWLGFFYKNPMYEPNVRPIHNLFLQKTQLENKLRQFKGLEPIRQHGFEYSQYGN